MTMTALTARRARLTTTRDDLTERLQVATAALERLDGLEPTPEHVSAFVEAEREHRDLSAALERTETLMGDLDAELERLSTDEANRVRVDELASVVRGIQNNRAAFTARMERLGEHLKTELTACLEHRREASRLHTELYGLVNDLAPGYRAHGSYYWAEPGQPERADHFAADFSEQYGLDLRDAFEGGASYPKPFGTALGELLNLWEREKALEELREEEAQSL